MAPNFQIFPKKEFLGKFKCKIYLPIAPHYANWHFRNIHIHKEIFWQKWLLPLPTYCVLLYHLTFPKDFYSESWYLRLQNSWPMSFQITHLPQNRISFGKFDCYYCLPTVLYYTATLQKKLPWADHQTKLYNLGSNWARVILSTKRELFGKVDQHYFGFL